MKEVTISELQRNPSAIFRLVSRTRKAVRITRRGAVIVEIVPCARPKKRRAEAAARREEKKQG